MNSKGSLMSQAIMEKYGEARLPRYTTAPHFAAMPDKAIYRDWIASIPSGERTSLYLHIPFCRSMC